VADVLTLDSRVERGCLILAVSGELVRYRCGRLINGIRENLNPGVQKVIIDARGLTHMTASALAELVEIHMLLAESGRQLVLAAPSAQVRRLLVLGFLDKLILTVPAVEDALGPG